MIRSILAYAGITLVGLVTGIVGAASHRYHPYWGAALVILLVLASATFARASKGWLGLSIYAGSWYLMVFGLFEIHGPGDSVVILDDALGRTLFVGGALAIVLVAFLPGSWMREPGEAVAASAAARGGARARRYDGPPSPPVPEESP